MAHCPQNNRNYAGSLLLSQVKEADVADDKEFRAGAFSGLFAVIMVVALAVMAMTALDTTQPLAQRHAQIEASNQPSERTAELLGLDRQ